MKLLTSPSSPYGRKVMACAIAREIDGRIECITANPMENSADLVTANPLSKIPCLLTDDGVALFDSPVICEYLDSLEGGVPMFPRPGHQRWRALKEQALADGVLEAIVLRRRESQAPDYVQRRETIARQSAVIDRGLNLLEVELPPPALEIGSISVACALGYLDLRYPDEGWRASRPKLSAWYAAIIAEPALARTAPPLV